ncbi:MAG: hypothetical protein U0804_13820 [Gemmataceae bacterium]
MTAPTEFRHIVRQHNWLRAGGVFVRAPGERRIAWYDTADEAVADQRRREQLVREGHNPFRFGTGWHHLTTMPMPIYRGWLMAEGIDPPAQDVRDPAGWQDWWDAARESLPAGQRNRTWEGLNRLRFHDVIARRPSETAYCVSRILWDYDDNWYHAGHEGGEPLKLFRTRERAERERERLEATVATDASARGYAHYLARDPELFLEYLDDEGGYRSALLESVAPVPHFEVVEIDLPGVPS